jgi:hypothetical protein
MTIGAGGSLRKVRLGNVEAAHRNRIVAIGKTTSSLNSEIMAQLRPQNGSGDCAILMVNAPLMAEPSRPRDHWGGAVPFRLQFNPSASDAAFGGPLLFRHSGSDKAAIREVIPL